MFAFAQPEKQYLTSTRNNRVENNQVLLPKPEFK